MSFGKINTDDYDFVDVEGEAAIVDAAGTSDGKPAKNRDRSKKKTGATLEEGNIRSSLRKKFLICEIRTHILTMLLLNYYTDLQFSSEEEFDEVPLSDGDGDMDNKMSILVSAEVPSENIGGADDDSQQAAEAMMQLGNIGFYQQAEQNEPVMFKGKSHTINM